MRGVDGEVSESGTRALASVVAFHTPTLSQAEQDEIATEALAMAQEDSECRRVIGG